LIFQKYTFLLRIFINYIIYLHLDSHSLQSLHQTQLKSLQATQFNVSLTQVLLATSPNIIELLKLHNIPYNNSVLKTLIVVNKVTYITKLFVFRTHNERV
jgi:hypothetical protein